MNEIWKPVKGYEGLYEVSNLGNVKSLDRFVINHKNKKQFYPSKTLKKSKRKNGYLSVILSKNNIQKNLSVHRLVAISFIPNNQNKKCVNHIDSDRSNNVLSNLEWTTHKENRMHGIEKGNVFKVGVVAIDKETKEKTFYTSIGHAVKDGYSRSSISDRVNCKIKNRFYKGKYWFKNTF